MSSMLRDVSPLGKYIFQKKFFSMSTARREFISAVEYIYIYIYIYIYVWIFENGVEKFNSRFKRAFFSRQKLSPKSTI